MAALPREPLVDDGGVQREGLYFSAPAEPPTMRTPSRRDRAGKLVELRAPWAGRACAGAPAAPSFSDSGPFDVFRLSLSDAGMLGSRQNTQQKGLALTPRRTLTTLPRCRPCGAQASRGEQEARCPSPVSSLSSRERTRTRGRAATACGRQATAAENGESPSARASAASAGPPPPASRRPQRSEAPLLRPGRQLLDGRCLPRQSRRRVQPRRPRQSQRTLHLLQPRAPSAPPPGQCRHRRRPDAPRCETAAGRRAPPPAEPSQQRQMPRPRTPPRPHPRQHKRRAPQSGCGAQRRTARTAWTTARGPPPHPPAGPRRSGDALPAPTPPPEGPRGPARRAFG